MDRSRRAAILVTSGQPETAFRLSRASDLRDLKVGTVYTTSCWYVMQRTLLSGELSGKVAFRNERGNIKRAAQSDPRTWQICLLQVQ